MALCCNGGGGGGAALPLASALCRTWSGTAECRSLYDAGMFGDENTSALDLGSGIPISSGGGGGCILAPPPYCACCHAPARSFGWTGKPRLDLFCVAGNASDVGVCRGSWASGVGGGGSWRVRLRAGRSELRLDSWRRSCRSECRTRRSSRTKVLVQRSHE